VRYLVKDKNKNIGDGYGRFGVHSALLSKDTYAEHATLAT
jgi:hypothetical protein